MWRGCTSKDGIDEDCKAKCETGKCERECPDGPDGDDCNYKKDSTKLLSCIYQT